MEMDAILPGARRLLSAASLAASLALPSQVGRAGPQTRTCYARSVLGEELGRYRVTAKIGEGGMGAVFSAKWPRNVGEASEGFNILNHPPLTDCGGVQLGTPSTGARPSGISLGRWDVGIIHDPASPIWRTGHSATQSTARKAGPTWRTRSSPDRSTE